MKSVIQIPCYDEAEHLPITLAALPGAVPDSGIVKRLVIADRSARSGSPRSTRPVPIHRQRQ
jgi:hypothetical protein